ncbi:thiopeptide-type bacteriocin biosynthesis domain-containing protein [Mucilaginibacter pineti]|uniref:Thiopeptide-type bacteriocin biosynthesis domain-containing protein n=2 Tax=Mucilaginibacter pineti TaxID=1391627 RepID=A0A1G7L939_9SPHI|nr:thiopeptide-type bacteriocin biosynthesis domain-containing protein [Mucilaginibacter pineti]
MNIALCRTPVFNHDATLAEKWDELKILIQDSSPVFYQLIKSIDAVGLNNLDDKIKYTIWKYYNRAKYRATPFGAFAAISLIPVLDEPQMPIILNAALLIHEFKDWKDAEDLTVNSVTQVRTSRWFVANSTTYLVGQEIRYIRLRNGLFEIAAVTVFPQLQAILDLCRVKTSPEAIYENMIKEFKIKKNQTMQLLVQMVSLQLLLTDRSINVTGEDYFQRLNNADVKSAPPYLIAERKPITGGLNKKRLQEVQEWISFLTRHLPDAKSRELNKFREAFLNKFEHRAVPLMTAMDLETGIGYGDLGGHETDYELASWLKNTDPDEKKELQISYTGLHQYLLDQLIKGTPIQLEELISNHTVSTLPLPNTLSVLFHLWRGQTVIENMGGCTANALLGRFTIASEELENFGRQIAAAEENANPDILFFDVAYQMEKEVDNVNRRKRLYQFELPILTWSCDSAPLNFDDILVTVRGADIILWSKKHQKRMVPRIPSAYNYTRSDLAVFRFLCDLQHQGIKSDLNFKLYYLFPNLSHYPRVSYKNVIVSPESWLLPDSLLKAVKSENIHKGKNMLCKWLQQECIHFLFKAGHSDQTLCFDCSKDADVCAFLSYCRQHSQEAIYITEALVSDYDVLTISPEKRHVAQFVVNYTHDNQVYASHALTVAKDNDQTDRVISPGQDWLYFEIYCHRARANSILVDRVTLLLKANKGNIRKWFFIRYEDPLPHIRLRLQLKDFTEGYRLISNLKSLLDHDLKSSLVSDIQIKTYVRETDRYGSDRIELVEKLFFHDSEFVLTQLATKKNTDEFYASALLTMQHIVAIVFNGINEQILFVKQMADTFSKELNMNAVSFKKMNQRYKDINNNVNIENKISNILPNRLEAAYTRVFKACNPVDRSRLLADLFHMHINRSFNADQRSHEAILYQYLLKLLMTRRALATVAKT